MFNWLFRKTEPEQPLFRFKSDWDGEPEEDSGQEWADTPDLNGNAFDIAIADVHLDYAARHEGSGSYNMYFYNDSEIEYTKKLGGARYSIICEDGTEHILRGAEVVKGVDPTYYNAHEEQEQ